MSRKHRTPGRRPGAEPEERGDVPPGPDGPVFRIDRPPERIEIRITPEARADMEENKRLLALASDRELLRHALSLQKWAIDVIRRGQRVFVADAEGRIEGEMTVEPARGADPREIVLDMEPTRRR